MTFIQGLFVWVSYNLRNTDLEWFDYRGNTIVHINPLCGAQNSKAQYGLIYEDTRNTRGGLPQLTVVIKVNGDSKGTTERGPSLFWFVGFVVPL